VIDRLAGTIVAVALLAAASATGCVMPNQMAQMQDDMVDIQQQQRALRREQDETTRALEELDRAPAATPQSESGITREEYAELRLEIDRLTRQTQMTEERLRDVNTRLDAFSQQMALTRNRMRADAVLPDYDPESSPSELPGEPSTEGPIVDDPETAATAQPPGRALPDPEALYNTAYTDFSKGNYALAIAGFQEYQNLFPESALADNALYWIGECHYSQADYGLAVAAFDELLDRYPRSDKAAASDLKKALSFLEQNQVGTGIVQLRHVISEYPGTDEARIAQDKLSGLGSSDT
jgi:tol-pal system protein YbgF